MKAYLVGGAVRDTLLGLEPKERDFVVIGSSIDEMLKANFIKIGKTFPVFLHPHTKEEYALARTEKKTGERHTDFVCDFSPSVTLEEDLFRRDLTINAIVINDSGRIIDPFHGQKDLEARQLRHVSDAFCEDPLRILRVARFLSQLSDFEFSVHPETHKMIKRMVESRALLDISAERILIEMEKALSSNKPSVFFSYLDEVGATNTLWPELKLKQVKTLDSINKDKTDARFCALLNSLGKNEIERFCQRLNIANKKRDLALLVNSEKAAWMNLANATAADIISLLYRADAFRKRDKFMKFNTVCAVLTNKNFEEQWARLYLEARETRLKTIETKGIDGPGLGAKLKAKRIAKVKIRNGL
ncbi:MAG: CCA tRNA nucleotidyltransferase [Gammaproteobacteria bacterium]|nr:CCA tRNA nucleotidyltransferase [Gammaproteobacteria bacterium]